MKYTKQLALYTEASELGRTVSWVLRHSEEVLKELKGFPKGRVLLVDLLKWLQSNKKKFKRISAVDLLNLVKSDEKGRFVLFNLIDGKEVKVDLTKHTKLKEFYEKLDKSALYIGAVTGHSVSGITVELELPTKPVPETLYHGTTESAWENIKTEGLKPGGRHHVHLTSKVEVAQAREKTVLRIDAKSAQKEGWDFLVSSNPKDSYFFPEKNGEKVLPRKFISLYKGEN